MHISIFNDKDIQYQQKQLEHDIEIINQEILQINDNADTRNIRWDRDILKTTTKNREETIKTRKKLPYLIINTNMMAFTQTTNWQKNGTSSCVSQLYWT